MSGAVMIDQTASWRLERAMIGDGEPYVRLVLIRKVDGAGMGAYFRDRAHGRKMLAKCRRALLRVPLQERDA